jgi:hypothetical protein
MLLKNKDLSSNLHFPAQTNSSEALPFWPGLDPTSTQAVAAAVRKILV